MNPVSTFPPCEHEPIVIETGSVITLQDSRWRPTGQQHHSLILIERTEETPWEHLNTPFLPSHSTGDNAQA
jgi:hypothetical protein